MKNLINIREHAGSFAENKDTAKKLRIEQIMPALSRDEEVTIDFTNVDGVTQSFIHALLSDPIREFSDVAFNKLQYKSANSEVQQIITIVYRYMQESLGNENED